MAPASPAAFAQEEHHDVKDEIFNDYTYAPTSSLNESSPPPTVAHQEATIYPISDEGMMLYASLSSYFIDTFEQQNMNSTNNPSKSRIIFGESGKPIKQPIRSTYVQ